VSSPTFAITITGSTVVNCGFSTDCTSSLSFTADAMVELLSATFDFAGLNVQVLGVATDPGLDFNTGLTSVTRLPTTPSSFGFTATGFNSGDDVQLGWSLVRKDAYNATPPFVTPPRGQDMDTGVVTLTFSNNIQIVAALAGPTAFVNNARANFSFVGQDPDPVPTPEPGTVLLLGSALGGLAIRRRRCWKVARA
jgi:hypothetical protein